MATELPTRTLGRTGLEVTQLGFGAMEFRTPEGGEGRETSEEQAEKVLNAVLDFGITFVDTAPDYGVSEERIGKYISHRRDEFTLATKCGCNIDENGVRQEPSHLWTGDRLRRNIDQSLERMKTDHVDVLQMHGGSLEDVEKGGLIEVLQEIRDAGKTRFFSVSSTAPNLMQLVDTGAFDTFQIPYCVLERKHEQMIQQAADAGCGIVVRGGIGKGHCGPEDRWAKWDEAGLDDLLDGMNRYEFVLRYTLTHPACHTTIVGTLDLGHLEANVTVAKAGPLPSDIYEHTKERMSGIGENPLD